MFSSKQLLSTSFILLASSCAIAYPKGCEVSGFAFQNNHLVLNDNGQQTLFMIQNIGKVNLQVEHVETRPDVFMSPKLESKININQWSAFSSDIGNFYLKCSISDGDNVNVNVNCADYLSICQYPRAKFPLSNYGTYWVSTNKDISQVIQETVKKGIYLKW